MPPQFAGFASSGERTTATTTSFGLLDLFLGTTGIRTPDAAWEFLTARELANLRCISKSYRENLERRFEYLCCRDGRDYIVPFLGFPGLLRHAEGESATPTGTVANGNSVSRNEHNRAGLYPHQLASLRAMHELESRTDAFGALRGGVLGDAPGLGKTITTLALLSSTAGRRPLDPPEFWDSDGIKEGWRAMRGNPAAREEVLRCLKPVRHVVSKEELDYLSPPYFEPGSLRKRQANTYPNREDLFPSLESFRKHLHKLLRGKGFIRPRASRSEWELVRQNLKGLQMGMDKRNRKLMASKEGRRLTWERQLIPTTATLLAVPDALFEHWFQQIREHLCLSVFAEDGGWGDTKTAEAVPRGVVYLDGLGDLADVTTGAKALKNTSALTEPVLNAAGLSGYLIVIVTFSRCRRDFKSEHDSMSHNDDKSRAGTKRKRWGCCAAEALARIGRTTQPSSLLQLRWLRLMVDEGHQLETDDALAKFIHKVAAERRWVISGTPLTGNEDNPEYNSAALDQLQRILYFLRHPRYGVSKSEDVVEAWETEVKKPFLARQSREKLLAVLREIMVMHRKEDLKLPEPVFLQIEREVSVPLDVEAAILQQAMDSPFGSLSIPYGLNQYLHSPEFQSLVDAAQATYVLETLQRARKALVHNNNQSTSTDTRPIKGVVYSSSNKDLLSVADQILRAVAPESVAELYGNSTIADMSSELERFRHGNRMYRTCPVCGGENATTDLRCRRILMEVVSSVTGERFLIEPERVLSTRNVSLVRLQGEPLKNYPANRKFWRVRDLLEVDVRGCHPLLSERKPHGVWDGYGAEKCRKKALAHRYEGRDWFFGPLPDVSPDADHSQPVPMEVILKKWQRCGDFHNKSWYAGPGLADSPVMRRKEDVFLLCLDADLGHGLDLSFVTHIFLLEPINDAALLEQVTSRAHRLGATGPVSIETINTFYKCSDEFQKRVDGSMVLNQNKEQGGSQSSSGKSDRHNDQLSLLHNAHRKASLTRVVCHHCYRQFDSYAEAEDHEKRLCLRNPKNAAVADKFHLSSVYKEIRPPLPMESSSITEGCIDAS